MSDFQVWDEVWSDADVLFDYGTPNGIVTDNPSTSLVETNLKVWMPLNEGSGDVCVDNATSVNKSAYGIIKLDGQTITELWETGQDSPSPQLAMQDFTIGNNVLLNTFDSNTDWTLNNSTVIPSLQTPAKGYGGQKITRNSGGNSACSAVQAISVLKAGDVCVSVYVKAGSFTQADTITSLALRNDGARTLYGMEYDWSTGTASVRSGSPSINNMTATDVGNGWFRLSFSVGGFSVSDSLKFELYGDIETFDAGNGIYFFGPQLEYGKNPTAVRLNEDETAKYTTAYTTYYKQSFNVDTLNTTLRSRENSFNADGRGWAQVADNSTLDFGTGAYTMECWAKFKYVEQGDGAGYNVIATLGGNGIAAFCPSIGVYSNHVSGGSSIYFKGYAGSTGVDDSSTTFTKGDWYHIVLTRDGSGNVKFYVDATLKDTATNTNSATNTDDPQIGRDSTTNRYYGDLISDVRYYNIALTQDQIQENYDAGTAAHSN
jgi:hypothetical protein